MDRIETVGDVLNHLAETLDADYLEPEAGRPDWAARRADVARLRESVKDDLFAEYAGRLDADEARGEDVLQSRLSASNVLGELVALLHLSGDALGARALTDLALSFAPRNGPERDELLGARADLAGHARLIHARWLLRHKRWKEGDAVLKALLKRSDLDARLRVRAQALLDGPRPLEGGAPALFTVNGFGVVMYGRRDPWPDGSYVATTWLSALFIPLFPLKSYRVRNHENGGWVFFAREKLSTFARGVRAAVLVGAAATAGVVGFNEWRDSPSHQAAVAMANARQAERQHRDAAALRAYEELLQNYASRAEWGEVREAAFGVVRLAERAQPGAATADDVDRLLRIVRHYDDLPPAAKQNEVSRAVLTMLRRWIVQIGDATPAAVTASMRLAEAGARVADPIDRDAFVRQGRALHGRLAAHHGTDWPLEALPEFVRAGDEGTAAALPVVTALLASPSLALAAATDLEAWRTAARRSHDDATTGPAATIAEVLTAARAVEEDPARRQALESGDRPALETALRAHPGDQSVIAALAAQRHREGNSAEALRQLAALGGPGRMIPAVRGLYAQLAAESGRVAEADEVLTRTVEPRLPRYQAAQRALMTAAEQEQRDLVDRARRGDLPSDISQQLRDQPEAEQQRIFGEWLTAQLRASTTLAALRTARDAQADVVPLALSAGMIKLRRANTLAGAERQRVLGEAERLFLAIRDQAEGSTDFRLGLGQVYHRLGRQQEGDAELSAVLRDGAAREKLAVANVYRELGRRDRAREVTEAVFNQATGDERMAAAMLMSIMSDTEEAQEQWLRRAGTENEAVRLRLREVEARRALSEGRLADADRAFAEVAAGYIRRGNHDSASTNNASIANFGRYAATGDIAHINSAVQLLERSRAGAADNAIVALNLAEALSYQGFLRVLGGFVRVATLRPSEQDAQHLLSALAGGTRRDAVLTAMRRDPSLGRALEMFRQAETLAPQSVRAYRGELDELSLLDDDDGLRGLLARIDRAGRLDTAEADADWRAWLDGSRDGESGRSQEGRARVLDRAVTEAEQAHDAPTLAATLFLRASLACGRSTVTRDLADARQAAQLARRAATTWDGLPARRTLADALLLQETVEAAGSHPVLAASLGDDLRGYGLDETLFRARRRPGGPEALAALQARPAVAEALGLYVAAAAVEPAVGDVMLARALEDPALTTASAPALTRDADRVAIEIAARLISAADARERLALFRR